MSIEFKTSTTMTEYGRFLNPKGYKAPWDHNESTLLIFRKAIFEFKLLQFPLMFEHINGDVWMPDKHFFTDWGSIPVFLQILIPKDTYLGYLFHDSSFLHHGLWVCRKGESKFIFQELTMKQCNELLYQMMMTQGAWKLTATTVYDTLQIAGRIAWNDAYRREKAGTQQLKK